MRFNTPWIVYNILKSAAAITLIIVFIVQVLDDHSECLSKQGTNITAKFEVTLMGGLILSCVDLLVTGLTVVMRVCVVAEEQEKLKASFCKSVMLQMLVSLVYIVDALALLFILHSYNIMTSKTGQYCIKQTGIL